VGGILGRHDDLVIYKGADFYPVQVEIVVRSDPDLSDELRIRIARAPASSQVRQCAIVAELLPLRHDRIVATRLRGALRAELGVTPEVVLVPFGTLERTTFRPSGSRRCPAEVPNTHSNLVCVSDGLSGKLR
jgi:phenylacetate-CoA ligase